MSADVLFPVFVNLQAIAAGTAEQRHITIPMAGTWEVLSDQCFIAPSTTSAANGTNARVQGFDITFNKAADMIDDLLAVIEDQEETIGYLKGATS